MRTYVVLALLGLFPPSLSHRVFADQAGDRAFVAGQKAEQQFCQNLQAAASATGKNSAQLQKLWDPVYAQDSSLHGTFSFHVQSFGPDVNPGLMLQVFMKGSDGKSVPVWSSAEGQDMQSNHLLQLLKVFKSKFGMSRDINVNEIIKDLKANNPQFPQGGLDRVKSQSAQPSQISQVSGDLQDNVWKALRKNVIDPRVEQCNKENKAGLSAAGADSIDRIALHDKDSDVQLIGCAWKTSEPPHALLAGCGTFCSGSADCTYKMKNGPRTVTRTIGCHVSSQPGQVNCGDATKCHQDPIRFPTASFETPTGTVNPVPKTPTADQGG
jgi:hypothetical protein